MLRLSPRLLAAFRRRIGAGSACLGALLGALLAAAPASTQLTIRLEVPAGTPAGAEIYVAGSFNRWNPAAPGYRLTERGGTYVITLPDSVRGRVEFKFTRGSWDTVETDSAGGDRPNRSHTVPPEGADSHHAEVAAWREPGRPRHSTASPSVSLLSAEFPMPELQRTRRVWIYLPPGYETSTERYPVLYMHDGQNLFDEATGFAGEWRVDETLDSLSAAGDPGVIVVAVDHGGERRLDEYSPWVNPRFGGGEGERYVEFLVNTLKPHIDRNYRTRPGREHNAIAGSSMGGLISLYAALEHPEIFGSAGVFSPALWFSDSTHVHTRAAARREPRPRLYFVTGALEGERPELYVEGQQRMVETLTAAGYRIGSDLVAFVCADGTHSEWFWRREFPAAYRWLFAGTRATGERLRKERAAAAACAPPAERAGPRPSP